LTRCWRIKNLGGLIIGQNVLLRPDGRVVVAIHESEVKNYAPIETELSPRLESMMHIYLDKHIALLSDSRSGLLFPGTGTGRAKTLGALNQNINSALTERVGVDASNHFFRHFSAKLILDHDPTAIRIVQVHLGHQHLSSTAPYADRRGAAAATHVDGLIEGNLAEGKIGRAPAAKRRKSTDRKGRK